MPEMTTVSKAKLASLEGRLRKLAADKAHLQLIVRLMNRISAVSGLDNIVEALLQAIGDVIGGINLCLYYVLDDHVYYNDAFGHKKRLDSVDDSLVKEVFETRKPIEHEHAASDTQMLMTPEFTNAYTWAVPLLVGEELIAVIKIESLHVAMRELSRQLPTFFSHAAFVLKNEILGQTRLKKEYDKLEQEVALRKKAKGELLRANELLEERVAERTAELQSSLDAEKQAEEALRKNESLLRAVLDNAPFELWARDTEERCIMENSTLVKHWGSILGKRPEDTTISSEDLAVWKANNRRAFSGELVQGEVESIMNGEKRFFQNTITPIRIGEKVLGILGFNIDITERKQAEEVQRRLNRELRAISNCNQILMRAEDEETLLHAICHIVCDEADYRMAWVGYAEHDEAKTIRPVVWAGVEDGYLAAAKITWADTERGQGPSGIAIRTGKSACIQDFALDPQAAPWRESALQRGYQSSISLPLKDETANIFGALTIYSTEPNAFTRDEVRLLEELAGDLAFGITTLRGRVERRRAQEAMKQAKEVAEAANKAKDQFLAMLSHELRTPLTPVLATVSALQAQEEMSAELRADMDLIRRNVEMEAKLVDDLLDVTKISRGKMELHPEVVDAHLLLRTALEICQKDIEAKHMEVTLSLQADPHQVRADPTRLRQVFWNLLKNAVEFNPAKGRIRLRTTNAQGRLKIEIEDTGVGIRPEMLPKIFNAFERGDQTGFRRFGGLGLGLSIAKTVVEMHQGTLTAFSEGEGKGATFTVELPAIAPTPPPQPPPLLPHAGDLRKILLVDDHADTLQTMSKLLNKWGYAVVTADCVRAALEAAARESFDVLLSDLGLPDGSGMDIMREVKRLYSLRGIALSGYGTEEDIRRSLDAGFEIHLTKPVSFQDLRNAVRAIVAAGA